VRTGLPDGLYALTPTEPTKKEVVAVFIGVHHAM
jgi:hypothetical protein